MPLETMLGTWPARLNDEAREAVYGRGWLLTHYLTFEPKRAGQLGRYLGGLNQGKPGIEVARAAFGDLKQLGRELESYLKRSKISALNIKPAAIATPKVEMRALNAGEAAMMTVRVRSEAWRERSRGQDAGGGSPQARRSVP
jgi:hypothetical protein